jgi:hypothetical protein
LSFLKTIRASANLNVMHFAIIGSPVVALCKTASALDQPRPPGLKLFPSVPAKNPGRTFTRLLARFLPPVSASREIFAWTEAEI